MIFLAKPPANLSGTRIPPIADSTSLQNFHLLIGFIPMSQRHWGSRLPAKSRPSKPGEALNDE